MIHRTLSVIVLSLLLSISAASSNTRGAQPPQMLVQTDWLAAHLNDPNIVILHVGGDRRAYDSGHIPGARFLALSDIAVTRNGIPNELPPVNNLKTTFERLGVGDQSRVVLYGDMYGLFATRAYFTLDYLGHGRNTALLDGGLEKWQSEQRNISTGLPTSNKAGTLTVKARPDLIIELPAVRQIVTEKKLPLIDARSPSDFSGGRSRGHIPGAKNVFWIDNLVSQGNPILKPAADIRARYQAAGIKPGSKVIVYCQTGVQAAHDYFTLKLVSFTPVLYDGSFVEWSSAFGTPIETGAPVPR
jgi:thiosulfate/3-mercaptopyruvate sulfurtransferase